MRDFFQAGVEAGFTAFEVSGLTGNAFYDEIHPSALNIVSLHDPAPGEMKNKAMRLADIVLTSLDEERRRRAVAEALRSIEVARRYGAQAVVLHLGQTSANPELEDRLKRLFAEERIAGSEADAVRSSLIAAPGAGSIDWAGLAELIASRGNHVVRTVEVNHAVSEQALRAGLGHLRSTGWAQE